MLDSLKFVQGAVAKKDFVNTLTHFNIKEGRITGFNGLLALSSPIPLDIDITPKATQLFKAIAACTGTVQLHLTPSRKLAVRSGKFQAYVDCIEEPYPDVQPEGEVTITLPETFLDTVRALNPFVAEDDSRRWARGILFKDMSAMATNNVVLVEYWTGHTFPTAVSIPKPAVQELLRIGVTPTSLQIGEKSITFHYEDGRWLRTQQYETSWPDISKVLDKESNQQPADGSIFEAINTLAPFVDDLGRIFFLGDTVATSPNEEATASIKLSCHAGGIFNLKQLALLEGVATTMDLSQYPAPCLFYGHNLRGAISGMRAL